MRDAARRLIARAPWRAVAAVAAATVFWLSLTPQPPQPAGLPDRADLAAHAIMHAGLALTLARGFPALGPALACALAVYLEVAQLSAPGRTFALSDLAANGLGVVIGLWLARRIPSPAPLAPKSSQA
jgi:VanZ family protein